MREKSLWWLLFFIVVCELVGVSGTPFTVSAIPTWYASLNRPPFSPPNWIFGPVWTLLYAMMGASIYLVFREGWKSKKVKEAFAYFVVQLVLNFSWSFLFFGLRNPLLGLIDIVLLWIAIFLTIKKFYKISKPAAYLLIPYLMWVTFASLLNLSIFLMN